MSDQLRGRQLFCANCTLQSLQDRLNNGAVVKKTQLTEVFDLNAFRAAHPDALPMFLLSSTGELSIITEDLAPVSRAGQTVVSLTDPAVQPPPQANGNVAPVATPQSAGGTFR
jgi:hypothetical protein